MAHNVKERAATAGSAGPHGRPHPLVSRWELAAATIVALGVAARFAIDALGWPQDDSDEGTMGLMALHILARGARPVFFYGQHYMGALEAYLGAAAFSVFGPSVVALRLGPLLLFAIFLASTYLLGVLLYDRRVALVSIALLALGARETLWRQLEAGGGYAETLAFGSVVLLLTGWLAITATAPALSFTMTPATPASARVSRTPWLRWAAYVGGGLAAGLGVWSDLLMLPFVAAALGILVTCCRRELRSVAAVVLVAGFVAGAWPLIAYNLTAAPGQDSLSVFLQIASAGGTGHIAAAGALQRLAGTVFVSLPAITGANPLCPLTQQSAWPITPASGGQALACTGVHALWGVGYLALGVVAAASAVWTLRRRPGGSRLASQDEPASGRETFARATCRLALLAGAGVSLASYTISSAPALQPWTTARYLLGLLIATPALLSPLLGYALPIRLWRRLQPRVSAAGRYTLLGVVGVVLLVGMADVFVNVTPAAAAHNQQTRNLIARLESGGMTRIYTDYWTCDRLAFQSNERIVCAVLDERLHPGQNRYPPYLALVRADPRAAYVFAADSPQAALMARRAARAPGTFERLTFDGYVVYQPVG